MTENEDGVPAVAVSSCSIIILAMILGGATTRFIL